MGGRHAKKKYKVKKHNGQFIVVIQGSDKQVPGTPTYETRADAQSHVDKLNN